MKVKGQLGMDETVIDDADLEAALEARWAAAMERRTPMAAFRNADEKAKTLVKAVVAVGQIARVGRFRIERVETDARHVEFDAEAGDRVKIKADGEQQP